MDTTTSSRRAATGHAILALARTGLRLAIAGAVLAVTVALVTLTVLPHLGARGLIVTSGSMEPAVGTGDLAVVQTVDPLAIRPGDVITYTGYTASGLTTHRVVQAVEVGDRLHFQTKGDANDTPDADLAPAEGVLGRVVVTVPGAGRALAHLNDPVLRLLVLGVPAAWFFLRSATAMIGALRADPSAAASRTAAVSVIVVLAVAAPLLHRLGVGASAAVLTDAVTIVENTFSTGIWT